MARMEKTRGYAHRLDLRTGVTPVWAALTDSRLLTQWCSPDALISARPGGLFRARVDRVTELEACIDILTPGKRLRQPSYRGVRSDLSPDDLTEDPA